MDKITIKKIAVLIPCYNEAKTIGKVINDFKANLPDASIYVFDNCCTDATPQIAIDNGAILLTEPRQGKGFVVEGMFDKVDADIYIMVDGDDTYPADYAAKLITPIIENKADMVVGARLAEYSNASFRPMHVFGNNLVRSLVNWMGGSSLSDIMSGYRAFNRRVVDMIPTVSSGFEIETELTIQMLYYKRKIIEVQVPYRERPEGSQSKLHTFRDGARVLWKIFSLFRAIKPLTFFGCISIILLILSLCAGYFPIHDYLTAPDHFVSHVPFAILATGLMILSAGSFFLGIVLHAINWRFIEMHNVLSRTRYSSNRNRDQ